MTEIGIVTRTDKNTATVKVDKKDECSKCGMCLFKENAGYTEFKATNKENAKVGDTVRIETSESAKGLGIILVFGVPLILIGLSALITFLAIKVDYFMPIIAVPLVVLWFIFLPLIDKKIEKNNKFRTSVTQIIEIAKDLSGKEIKEETEN